MADLIKFPQKRLKAVPPKEERKKPKPRKKMVEVTVYDCPLCGTELTKPTDPDVRVIMSFQCPNCGYCF
jgi:predicted RNA-binding Zn-ribbon protein involved in translation (DUF1610 family)